MVRFQVKLGRRTCAVVVGAALVLGNAARGADVHMVGTQHMLEHTLRQPDEWFKADDARRLADVIVSWQNADGGWWKKYDPTQPRPAVLPPPDPSDGPPGDTESVWRPSSTIDNTSTYSEMRILAKVYAASREEKYKQGFLRGMEYLLKAQYPNGGWPQRYPLQDNYGREITFNDGAMTGAMAVLRDAAEGRGEFGFVSEADRTRCRQAVERGVECTLACQIKKDGKLTVWCQQYDEEKLTPAGARAYELPSLTSSESAEIVIFLMELPHPDERVRAAVESAVQWFRESKIEGKRFGTVTGPQYERGHDRVLVDDPNAPPIWARFYDLETNRPFFVSRDGVKRTSVDQISHERRNGYAWYGNWGTKVEKAYAAWKKREVAPADGTRVIRVSPEGTGDFKTLQAAVDAVPDASAGSVVIRLAPGVYHERVVIPESKVHVTLSGEDAKTTVITFDRNAHFLGPDGKEVGTFQTQTVAVDAPDFSAENVTLENTAGDHGQALALSATGDRQVYRNCRLIGWQDTLFANGGRQYYDHCYIEGRVDFIFGSATAVFDHCTIHSKNGGYVTAANTPPDQPCGYAFLDCVLTGEGALAYLGRPWRWDRGSKASVTFVRCRMGPHVRPEGWNPWHRGPTTMNTHPESNTRYAEFGSKDADGRPLDVSGRVPWSRQLTADEAAGYTVEKILAGSDHWDPTATVSRTELTR